MQWFKIMTAFAPSAEGQKTALSAVYSGPNNMQN